LPVIDLAPGANVEGEVARIINEEMTAICDLGCGPLMRFSLIRVNETEHRLLRVYHHILADAWSAEVLISELTALYESLLDGQAVRTEPAPLQYADYAAWQRKTFQSGGLAYEHTIAWWKQRFPRRWPRLVLPFKRPSPARGLHPSDGQISLPVDSGIERRVAWLRRECAATDYTIWLSALIALLAAETKQSEIAIGTYITTRRRADLQNVIGDFTCLAVLGFRCDLTMSFFDWVTEVRHIVAQTERHSEMPYEVLRNTVRHLPPIEMIFGSRIERQRTFSNLVLRRNRPKRPLTMPWGFSLGIVKTLNGDCCNADFDASLYEPTAVRKFVGRLFGWLDAVSCQPYQELGQAGCVVERAGM
jgi:hypothetical protein